MFAKCKLIYFCCIAVIIVSLVALFACTKSNNVLEDANKLSVNEKLEQAEERNDIEMLQEEMPWLDIISARWKQIVLGDYHDWIPGPTDIMTTGLLTLDSDYLREIRKNYLWYEDSLRDIPSTFLTNDMEGYVLYTSQE